MYATDGTVYAVGEGAVSKTMQAVAVLVYNGHTWVRAGQVTAAAAVPNQISSDGDGGIWFPLIDAQTSGSAAVGHYVRSVKANPATYAELEFYN